MIKYLQENFNIFISVLSLIIAFGALSLNRKTSRLNSYNQKSCYHVFLIKKGLLTKFTNKYDFSTKIFPSISSKTIPFDYSLCICPYIGGIYRAHIFSTFDNEYSLGTYKTCPTILTTSFKGFSQKKYANKAKYYMSSTPLFPYIYAFGKFNENTGKCDNQLNRYHFYIEITDYCNNTQIWYMSFSLLLSNTKESKYKWNKCTYYSYEYYTFHDINIVSPKDIPMNFDRTANFKKTIEEIINEKENSLDSINLMEHGFEKMEYDLQLYEMKEYISLLERLNIDYTT